MRLFFETYARVVLVLGLGLLLPAQITRKTEGPYDLDKRIAVIETKLDNLRSLDDRVSKLNDKIDGLTLELSGINSQLAAINTKIELIQWIGGVLGGLLLAYLWSATVSDRQKLSKICLCCW